MFLRDPVSVFRAWVWALPVKSLNSSEMQSSDVYCNFKRENEVFFFSTQFQSSIQIDSDFSSTLAEVFSFVLSGRDSGISSIPLEDHFICIALEIS